MEHSSDQSSAEGKKNTGNGATFVSAACTPKHKNKLKRHRSMENLPAELKSTQDSTISIFFEYVRNRSVTQKETEKQTMHSDDLPRFDASVLDSDVESASSAQQRANQCIERLQSEPHGDSQVRVVVSSELKHQPSCSTAKSRPSTLLLSPANASVSGANKASKSSPPKHKRMLCNSGSDVTTTPVADPPLFSPGCVSALEATYPPARVSRCRSSSSPLPLPQYDWRRHQICCAGFEQLEFPGVDKQNARTIAERLKVIGDKLEQEHGEERLSSIVNSCIYSQPITITRFLRLLSNLRSCLNWQKVSELFVLGYRLLEIMTQAMTKPYEDERWWLFEKLWDFLVNTVARWVMENGGWEAFLQATDSFEGEPSIHHGGRSPDNPGVAAAAKPRLWSLSESGSIVDEDGISFSETTMGNEDDRESVGSCRHASCNGQVFAADSESLVSEEPSADLPGSTSSLHQEFHDSGIVSLTDLLSLETQDEGGHEDDLASTSCVFSESDILQDSGAYELQESDSLMDAGTATSLDESNSEPQPFDRNRSRSLPVRGRGARPNLPRRASERALHGLLYTVNIGVSAAFVYAVVRSLLNN